ncbi:MAG: hypothetical protein Q8L88_02350 [Bacteroidota bacterium]|nr:hypothetical protein [Bacteroidota bacterium]
MNQQSATMKELMNHQTLLVNKAGDQIWRYVDSFDGKAQFKVFAVEPRIRTQIKNWEDAIPGADYFIGGKYFATDYIVPKKYLNRITKLLEFDLRKNTPRAQTELQKEAFRKLHARRMDKQQVAMEFAQPMKVA